LHPVYVFIKIYLLFHQQQKSTSTLFILFWLYIHTLEEKKNSSTTEWFQRLSMRVFLLNHSKINKSNRIKGSRTKSVVIFFFFCYEWVSIFHDEQHDTKNSVDVAEIINLMLFWLFCSELYPTLTSRLYHNKKKFKNAGYKHKYHPFQENKVERYTHM
jgi:hypothetical protein